MSAPASVGETTVVDELTEARARVLLFGIEALPVRERWLLLWLLGRPERRSIAFEATSGMGSREFSMMCSRWREFGLLTTSFCAEHDACLPTATDFAAMVAGLVPATPPFAFPMHASAFDADLIDLDAV